ncbi:MAG: ferredoxin family protein [Deferribacterales bacterium]|jgi:2-oxoglutarate ferredoxin oxidoreductase subunit delta|uniref:4Fe-4S ferredoxin iron-sulfur binding domain protein n=1 Tax=Denitrovibrio acetiphilus (strain DSM 12809 / NBRC 114555 / N2460) TaxID=522772 RepID=D4H3K3_DENA2|nr:4Fe-4S binding protein [Denitrovibrio acetiphilus]ADD69105.1 4Fe-4S ferredoxin iron-sulfur binding domain protein [Denitrovibrio acetiphilus DSM 12809]
MAKAEKIEIYTNLCKGCEICVELCPVDALEMKDFKAAVKDLDKCIACMQCELRCPDFAIEVYKK